MTLELTIEALTSEVQSHARRMRQQKQRDIVAVDHECKPVFSCEE